jgi:hypothetical protein
MVSARVALSATSLVLGLALVAVANAEPPKLPRATAKGPPAGASGAPTIAPVLEPKAIDLLKAMSARLAAAQTLSFTATTTYESPSRLGPPLAYTTVSEVTLQRPDKLRVITPGDGPAFEFYDDGKVLLAYAPAENLVAVADAPPSVDAALKSAFDTAAIYFPFTDVIVADPYADIAEGLELAFVVGQSHVVGGTTTDIVAIVAGRAFEQIWIGTDDKLPRRIRAVYAHDPSRLRHQVDFSNWRVDGEAPAEVFTSTGAASAKRIPFARPDPKPAADAGSVKPAKPAPKN